MTCTRLTKAENAIPLLWISVSILDSIHRRHRSSGPKKSVKFTTWSLSQTAQMRKQCKVWGIGKVHGLDIQLWSFLHPCHWKQWRVSFGTSPISLSRVAKSVKIRQAYFCSTQTVNINQTRKKFMLEKDCAFANGDKWPPKINHIGTGSKVLLYANGAGIIAIGIATAEKRNITWDGGPGRFVKLREFLETQISIYSSFNQKNSWQ